jgi:hypothetical protein
VLVPVSPDDYHLLWDNIGKLKSLPVTLRVPGRGNAYAHGVVNRLPESDAKEVPVPLTHPGGGPLAIKQPTQDQTKKGPVPQAQQYLIEVDVTDADSHLMPGTMVTAKIHCEWKPAAWLAWRKIATMFDLPLI